MVKLLNDNNREYHLCCPIMDNKDCVRHTGSINSCMSSNDHMTSIEKNVCFNKCENCNEKADVALFCHSMYDMSTESVADMLERHEVTTAFGVIIFSPEILVK
jgi:hypothetical protein